MSRLFDPPAPTLPGNWSRIGNIRRYRQLNERDIRGTLPEIFAVLDREFSFTLDVAALPDNALCDRYFTPDDDGLAQPWAPARCWMNPPYSALGNWTRKALAESRGGGVRSGPVAGED